MAAVRRIVVVRRRGSSPSWILIRRASFIRPTPRAGVRCVALRALRVRRGHERAQARARARAATRHKTRGGVRRGAAPETDWRSALGGLDGWLVARASPCLLPLWLDADRGAPLPLPLYPSAPLRLPALTTHASPRLRRPRSSPRTLRPSATPHALTLTLTPRHSHAKRHRHRDETTAAVAWVPRAETD